MSGTEVVEKLIMVGVIKVTLYVKTTPVRL